MIFKLLKKAMFQGITGKAIANDDYTLDFAPAQISGQSGKLTNSGHPGSCPGSIRVILSRYPCGICFYQLNVFPR